MAKVIGRENVLRQPLNVILASEGNVRVLRELFAHGGELSPPEIGLRAGISEQQVRRVLPTLVAMSVVAVVGLGRFRMYRVREHSFFYGPLATLFTAEGRRYESLIERIRHAAQEVTPSPEAVWLYGSVARGEDRVGSDVDVVIVFRQEPVEIPTAWVRADLAPVEEQLGVRLSVQGLGHDDVLRLARGDTWWENVRKDAVALVGPGPDLLVKRLRREAQS